MLAVIAQNPALGLALLFGLGLLVGSFLNVVILRMPPRLEWAWRQEAREILAQPEVYEPKPPGLAVEASHCPSCGHKLRIWENVPLISFVFLRGQCSVCKTAISWQYPAVELITGILFAICFWRFGVSMELGFALVFTAALVALSGIDLRTTRLPDQIVLPLLWLGLLASLFAARAAATVFWGIDTGRPDLLGAAVAVLAAVAATACLLPAYRAARLDPAAALRHS